MPHDARSSRMEGALQKSPTIARLSRIALLLFDRARRKVLNKDNLRARLPPSRADRWESKVQEVLMWVYLPRVAPKAWATCAHGLSYPVPRPILSPPT